MTSFQESPCEARARINGKSLCWHPDADKYKQEVKPSDCSGCPVRIAADKVPIKEPTFFEKMKHLGSDLAKLVRNPRKVKKEHYEARMKVCSSCPYRRDNSCLACGCKISMKGWMETWTCDKGYWGEVDKEHGVNVDTPERRERNPTDDKIIVTPNGEVFLKIGEKLEPPKGFIKLRSQNMGGHKWDVYVSGAPECMYRATSWGIKRKSTAVIPHCTIDGGNEVVSWDVCKACELVKPRPKNVEFLGMLTKEEKEEWDLHTEVTILSEEGRAFVTEMLAKYLG